MIPFDTYPAQRFATFYFGRRGWRSLTILVGFKSGILKTLGEFQFRPEPRGPGSISGTRILVGFVEKSKLDA